MGKLRTGVIGMGYMGDAHARFYLAQPDVEFVGCAESFDKRREEVKEQLKVEVYKTPEELFAQGLDAVSICTPDDLHKDLILKAFENKVKVLVEKPLAISSADCEEILAKRPDPTYLMVGHDLRFDPRAIQAKRAIDQGKLGEILHINIWRNNTVANAARLGKRTSIAWFLGIHDIDLVLWMTGLKVKKVAAANGFKYNSPNWDYTSSHLIMDNDALVVMENHWLLPFQHSSQVDTGMKIVGSKGMLELELGFSEVSFAPMEGEGCRFFDTSYQPDDLNDVPSGDLGREIRAFLRAAAENTIPPITGEESYEAVKVIHMVHEVLEETGYTIEK